MNNLNNTNTSVFIEALKKDKSQVTKIEPVVVFRRVLGLGEQVNTTNVYSALQRAAVNVGKLAEFQKNFISKSFVGEVMCFDVGPDDWCKFKVVRETLPGKEKHHAINFILSVTDKQNGKRWDRLVGAISLEKVAKEDREVPVFRTISDMTETTEIEKIVVEEPKVDEPIAPAQEAVAVEAEPPKEEPPETPVFKKGDTIIFTPMVDDTEAATLTCGDTQVKIWDAEFKHMRDTKSKTYTVEDDITESSIKRDGYQIWAKLNLVSEELLVDPNEVIIAVDDVVSIRKEDDELMFWDEESSSERIRMTDPDIDQVDVSVKYQCVTEVTRGMFDKPIAEIMECFKLWEDPDEVVIAKGEKVNMEAYNNELYEALEDITRSMMKEPNYIEHFTLIPKIAPKKEEKADEIETTQIETTQEENQEMKKVVYTKDEEFELNQFPGKKFVALEDITTEMINGNNGDMSPWVKEIETQKIADPDATAEAPAAEAKPVGDIPVTTTCKEEHSVTEYLQMLFGVSTPAIMHVFSKLRDENMNNPTYRTIGTWPSETMIVYSNYTFSIVRMKNGAFYRCFVAHTATTDPEHAMDYTYLNTHADKDRWFMIANIQDREVETIMKRRHCA